MNQQQRYQAIQVRRWDKLRQNGYGFFVTEGGEDEGVVPEQKYRPPSERGPAVWLSTKKPGQPVKPGKQVWFHVKNLPPEIRPWFTRDYPGEPLLPTVSFTIGQTDKGEVAENIRLEPNLNREVIWRNKGQLLPLQLGQSVKIKNWPDDDLSVWETSDFWICELFKILPGCESGEGYIARVCKNFVLGENKMLQTHPSLAEDLNSYLLENCQAKTPVIFNPESLDDLCDR
ncbi:MAG: hypothetical protein ACRC8Y_26915, partial [Chroococcales cyanobacterium]